MASEQKTLVLHEVAWAEIERRQLAMMLHLPPLRGPEDALGLALLALGTLRRLGVPREWLADFAVQCLDAHDDLTEDERATGDLVGRAHKAGAIKRVL